MQTALNVLTGWELPDRRSRDQHLAAIRITAWLVVIDWTYGDHPCHRRKPDLIVMLERLYYDLKASTPIPPLKMMPAGFQVKSASLVVQLNISQ